jgi:hypothetical protein
MCGVAAARPHRALPSSFFRIGMAAAVVASCLVLSCLVLSRLVSSCLDLSCLDLSWLGGGLDSRRVSCRRE